MRTPLSIVFVSAAFSAAVALPSSAAAGRAQATQSGADLVIDQAKPPQAPGTQKPAPQTTKPKPPPTPKLPIGLRAFGGYESTRMSASKSFTAHTGSPTVPGFAVGADILNLWRRVFVRVGMSKGSTDGTRGFVDEIDRFVSNGVPLKIAVTNVELGVGWRTYMKKRPRIGLYAGVGMTKTSHSQESPDPQPGDNDSVGGTGFLGLFGFEYALRKEAPARPAKRQFVAGVEAQIRSAAGVLGESGSSLAFDEDNAGGFAIRALFGIRFRR